MSDPSPLLQIHRPDGTLASGRTRPRATPRRGDICDLCATALAEPHSHLADLVSRSLLCVCRPCFLLFLPEGAAQGRYRPVPERYVALSATDGARWDRLDIPIGLAFLFYNSAIGRVAALYPSPAGATESTLALDAWSDMIASAPELLTLEPDVEAVLRTPHQGSSRYVHRSHRCVLRAGWNRATRLERLRWRRRRGTRHRCVLRSHPEPKSGGRNAMMEVRFTVASVRAEPHAAAPTLVFRIHVEEASGALIQAALLRCQVLIDVPRRKYSAVEGERLNEIVGEPARWIDTMRPLLWMTVPLVLPRCQGTADVDLPISCRSTSALLAARQHKRHCHPERRRMVSIHRAGSPTISFNRSPSTAELLTTRNIQ